MKSLISFLFVLSFSCAAIASIPGRSDSRPTREKADQQCVVEFEQYLQQFDDNVEELVKELCGFTSQQLPDCKLTQDDIVRWMNAWYKSCMQRKGF